MQGAERLTTPSPHQRILALCLSMIFPENHFTLFRIMLCLTMIFPENRFTLFRIMLPKRAIATARCGTAFASGGAAH
ncbi:hypothetical protein H8A99_23050 [Bradyrhizobium sp. Arg68]|uniref:hypothetical protein n=1 Tax=Bradyrhizobium ivorense TaxID=2511166 RepID=UPI001E474099|nr:hypothetical protein [Bradyrhizobium ivorense]MCC8939272.1 hypothetical protein [Bradyrhizobium ivorense]